MTGRRLQDITPREMDQMRERHDARMLARHEREQEDAAKRDRHPQPAKRDGWQRIANYSHDPEQPF